ncbi:MAG: veratrol--corrinoid protein metyltransferase [Eubacteriaceae bacterium]|nr:veratrol--corrinoid protein metyltransferase [Eubacteriaceae bacterium]
MGEITPKENYLRLSRGELPDYLPMGFVQGVPSSSNVGFADLFVVKGATAFGVGKPAVPPMTEWTDKWGIPYVANEETNFAALPKPGAFLLDDVRKWDKVVKHPEMPERIDWEAMAAEATAHVDRSVTAVNALFSGQTPFQTFVAFMGFTEGLIALYEEPEACEEMINYIADFYMPIAEKSIEYIKPDILTISDDTASRQGPFFSMDIYRRIFKPVYERWAKPATDMGLPITFHNCGRCEDQLEDLYEIGVRYWNPAEAVNDLVEVKRKFNNRMVISGGWSFSPTPDISETDVREHVRATIDRLAPGGGYIFSGGLYMVGNREFTPEIIQKINGWISDEAYSYGKDFYK